MSFSRLDVAKLSIAERAALRATRFAPRSPFAALCFAVSASALAILITYSAIQSRQAILGLCFMALVACLTSIHSAFVRLGFSQLLKRLETNDHASAPPNL